VLVDDTGLTMHAWNGLPGAPVTWFLGSVGPQGIVDMAAGLSDRRATATVALGYATADGVRVKNAISHRRRAVEEMRRALRLA
jgi:XTP/dITP diphosphohydrolase